MTSIRTRSGLVLAAVLAASAATLTAASAAPHGTAPAPAACTPKWTIVPTPDHGDIPDPSRTASQINFYDIRPDSEFQNVAAVSGHDVWAMGDDRDWNMLGSYPGNGAYVTDTEHWDGTRWTRVPSPNVPFSGLQSAGVMSSGSFMSFPSQADGWFAGGYRSPGGLTSPLVEHWDGSRWTVTPTLSPATFGAAGGTVAGLAASSATDAWIAVDTPSNGAAPRLEHWNGTSWQYASYPGASDTELFDTLYGSHPDDVWALARTTAGHVTLHWNGTKWSTAPVPLPANAQFTTFSRITDTSPSDAWLVGYYSLASNAGKGLPLVEHWNGSSWSLVAMPTPAGNLGVNLDDVTAISASDAWAVGSYGPPGANGVPVNLTEHWNGTKWSVVSAPSPALGSILSGVSASSATSVWAVGVRYSPAQGAERAVYTQALRYGC